MREHRIFGAPGTGKTTELVRQIALATQRYGYSVVVCSFTKAAAAELHARDIKLPANRIATLHSLCRRSLGAPVIAEKCPQLKEWNASCGPNDHVDEGGTVDDPYKSKRNQQREAFFPEYSKLRNMMVPRSDPKWYGSLLVFAEAWETWKRETNVVDFTDMIQMVYDEQAPCPLDCKVLFADEAQDYSALELAVVRMWGEECEHFVIAGDDQQCIYGFKGASPKSFLFPVVPPEQKTVLNKSYRLPAKIRDFAEQWGNTMSHFEPKLFKPRAEGGEIDRGGALKFDNPGIVGFCKKEVDDGNSVMILASCSYMLNPTVKALRRAGIVFHNPYRRTAGQWNPLRGVERLKSFLRLQDDDGEMRWRDVWPWFEFLSVKLTGIPTGAKGMVRDTSKDDEQGKMIVTPGDFKMLAGIDLPPPDTDWLQPRVLPSKWPSFEYGVTIIKKFGVEELKKPPRVIVGTIHSVKGGESDTVLVFPDLSSAALREMATGIEGEDELIRLFYVAITRARKKLVIGRPMTSRFMKLEV